MPHNRLFSLKTLLFLIVLGFVSQRAEAQVPDTVYTKPELNQGLPTVPDRPVIVTPPTPRVFNADSLNRAAQAARQKAQDKRPPFRKRLFTGGNGNLNLGTYTFIRVAPILGYRVNERVSVGTGASYIYVNNPFFEGSLLGGNVFTQVMVYKTFFGHLEYELIDFRNNFTVLLAGAGYRQMASERFGVDLLVLLDLNDNARSFYQNPVIRVAFIYNL